MKVFSQYKKLIPFIIGSFRILGLSSCNLMGFMDKPSGDVQLLEAGRACLDKGDFTCARDYYQALSNSYADVKISESSLATLGENNIFFMADLFSALGSGTGNATTLITLAETAYARNKFDATSRTTIQTLYGNEASISDSTLKAYSQLITSLAMISNLLANGITSGGKLTAANIASDPTTCKAATTTCAVGSACVCAACDAGTGTGIVNGDNSAADMATSTNWSGVANWNKISASLSSANTAITTLTGSGSSGIFAALQALNGLGAAGNNCRRQILLQTLFP